MADIVVKIAINPAGGGEIGAISTSHYELLNNISIKTDDTGTFDILTNDKFQGTEMLAFNKGVLHFNKAGFLSNRKDGEAGRLQSSKQPRQYVWGRTNSSGYTLDKDGNIVELTITLESADPTVGFDSIVIIGDSVAKQFPVEAYLDDNSTPIYSDDAKWAIKFDENTTTHSIRFTKWNRPNYNAVLNSIRVMYKYINITDKVIEDISSLSETTSDASTINYGVIANSGRINITDSNGEIEDLIRDEILPNSDVELEVQYNGNTIQHHITSDTDYKSNTKEFNLSLTNKVKDLDVLIYKGYSYPDESRSLYDILFDVMYSLSGSTLTDNDFKLMTSNKCFASSKILNSYIDEEVYIYDYLKNIIIPYPVIDAGKTYRQIIDEICTVAQLRMFVNDKNEYEFISARPLMLSTDNPYLIENKIVMDEPTTNIVVKNKFDAIEISEFIVKDEIDYETNIATSDDYSIPVYQTYNVERNTSSGGDVSVGAYFNYEGISRVESFYTTGSFEIKKKQNNNINQILSVKNPEKDNFNKFSTNITLNYVKKSPSEFFGLSEDDFNKFASTSNSFDIEKYPYSTEQLTGILDKPYYKLDVNSTNGVYAISELSDDSYINVTEEPDKFIVEYKILTGKLQAGALKYDIFTSGSSGSSGILLMFDKFEAAKLSISIYGNKRTISFNEVSVSSPNISSSKYKTIVNANNLLQSDSMFNSQKISDVIKNNILFDYNNGIQSKQLDVVCYDIKDALGNIVINKNNGEILKPNNVIYSKGDNYPDGCQKHWRIFSREFIYDGEPYLKTRSEELKDACTGGIFNEDGSVIKSWAKMIDDGDIVIDGNSVVSSNPEKIYETLIIPSNITEIQANAFENCTGLICVSFPDRSNKTIQEGKYIRIGDKAFSGCLNIKKVNIPTLRGWSCMIFAGATSNPVYYAKSLYINNELLEHINITHKPMVIDEYSLPKYGFYNCESLKTVSLNYTVGELYGYLGDYTYNGCKNLQTVNISGVKYISQYSFENCENLSTVNISNDQLYIENGAFLNCSKLPKITLPSNTKEIGAGAFYGCTSLSSVTFEDSSATYKVTDNAYNEAIVYVNNASTNATNLKTTYIDYKWVLQ